MYALKLGLDKSSSTYLEIESSTSNGKLTAVNLKIGIFTDDKTPKLV